jgi:sugar O-acyltransferase (sialic acid O-acetyltransferase NeuD family)
MAYEYFTHDSPYEVAAFTADAQFIKQPELFGLPVVDFAEIETRFPAKDFHAFIAVGATQLNRVRARFYQASKEKGYRLASYVSSRAFVWHNVEIGDNAFILEDNTLQPFVRIGNNVTLWSGNHIGHGTAVSDHVFISSHVVISGLCQIGAYTFMGVNSATAEETTVSEDNFVAMGAIVGRSSAPDQVLVGNPAEAQRVGAKRFARVRNP